MFFKDKIGELPFIAKVETHLADHCNLACKGCSHYSPIAPENIADWRTFKRKFGANLPGGALTFIPAAVKKLLNILERLMICVNTVLLRECHSIGIHQIKLLMIGYIKKNDRYDRHVKMSGYVSIARSSLLKLNEGLTKALMIGYMMRMTRTGETYK
ncbi:MAG: hypothetical protein LBG80_14010 [Bacteroidales bacterium]|jgi:hypothetical protein|nr:hypothetical protein [Bacteroidales bacterium]